MLHLALFIIFGAICVAGAINLLTQKHPLYSALSLVVVMGALAGLYLLLGAEFLAAIQVIVYAGAIMVLFVFVIMLLNAGEEEHTRGSRIALIFGIPGMIVFSVLTTWLVLKSVPGAQTVPVGSLYGSGKEIGRLLFGDFLLPFEITSVLILIAIMGAVVLARKTPRADSTAINKYSRRLRELVAEIQAGGVPVTAIARELRQIAEGLER